MLIFKFFLLRQEVNISDDGKRLNSLKIQEENSLKRYTTEKYG